jgi:hypothetical protein
VHAALSHYFGIGGSWFCLGAGMEHLRKPENGAYAVCQILVRAGEYAIE